MNTAGYVTRSRLALVLSAVLFAGCSKLPSTSPDTTAGGASPTPSFVRVPSPNSNPQSFGAIPAPLAGALSVDGAVGGVLTVGRFTLEIPPGAFNGVGVVSISVSDPAVLSCQLNITPETLNGFAVPVNLIANCKDGLYTDLSALTVLWDNVVIRTWQPVPGTSADSTSYTVIAPLPHFSTYGIVDGKAGW